MKKHQCNGGRRQGRVRESRLEKPRTLNGWQMNTDVGQPCPKAQGWGLRGVVDANDFGIDAKQPASSFLMPGHGLRRARQPHAVQQGQGR